MQLSAIVKWAFRLLAFLLLLILVIENIQKVQFNFFGAYYVQLPLILLVMIFLVIGVMLGVIIGLIKRIQLKKEIGRLEKNLLTALSDRKTYQANDHTSQEKPIPHNNS